MQRRIGQVGLGVGAIALGLVAVLVAGCPDETQLTKLCTIDADCDPGFVCQEDGRCVCASDAACGENQSCNKAGFCQLRVGCDSSLDCPAGQFCDLASGRCTDGEYCTNDVQCQLGEICDNVTFQCAAGCRDAGDCRLGDVCECPTGTTCNIKSCRTGPCGDDSYCRYGERCVEKTPGSPKVCEKDTRGPFCDACTFGPGQDYCPWSDDAVQNFCLVDTSKAYGSYFCGVECAGNADCPWGFSCSDVLILTEQTCGSGGQGGACPIKPLMDCATDEDCPGGVCDGATKKCKSVCVGNEGDAQGFCTCLEDADCPKDTCDTGTFRCTISLEKCDPNAPNPCSNIYCKQTADPQTKATAGYCFIGRNCAPDSGIACDTVRSQ